MYSFDDEIVKKTIEKLINGKDYRSEVVSSINSSFFNYSLLFFKKIVEAKSNQETITMKWYVDNFINNPKITTEDMLACAGLNKKTVSNIYSSATKEICKTACNESIANIEQMLNNIDDDLEISLPITYNGKTVRLNMIESLIVMNALATKKVALRGGAWSSIGKKVEKPLLDKLCDLAGVPEENRNNTHFIKDKSKNYDREVDYKLISSAGKEYRVEVKLMGKGNPESADATFARDSDILVADTLSEQCKNQLTLNKIEYLELKNNSQEQINKKFKNILKNLNVPF
jgi:hypothetical protein